MRSNEPGNLQDLLARYVDRLNDGERIDKDEILAEHPVHGPEILEHLEGFIDWTVDGDSNDPLGTLGDYTLRRQIGRGGMGVVYEAWENSMDRTVALKVLPAGVAADEKALQRFVREAQVAGDLHHPNVVPVYGMGLKEKTPYYSMEYVEGETLAQILTSIRDAEPETETPFGPKDSAAYFDGIGRAFAAVADGLQHAHSKGVVHRDIKPSNLIFDEEGRLRILDFGLAHLEGQESLTLSGDFVGTPLYMSPEQARRKKIEVDHRTDVYSLGATMYELLCGRPPFRGKDHADTLSQIIERDPIEPRKVNPRVPRDLEIVVLKCLRKDSDGRYGTAEALAQDLRRFVRGDPVEGRPESRWDVLRRRARRARARIALAALAVFALALTLWLVSSRDAAQRTAAEATYDASMRRAAVSLLVGRFSVTAGTSESGWRFFSANRKVKPITRDELRELLAKNASDSIDRAMASLEELCSALPERIEAPYYLARAYLLAGRLEDARLQIDEVLGREPNFLPAIALRAELKEQPGGPEAVIATYVEEYRVDENGEETAWPVVWARAAHAFAERRWSEAASAYKLLASREPEPFAGSRLESYLQLGVALLEGKRYAEAQRAFEVARFLAGGAAALEPTLLLAKALYLDREPAERSLDELWLSGGNGRDDRVAVLACATYLDLHAPSSALTWAKRVADLDLGPRLRALCYQRLHQTDQAVAEASRAMGLHPRDPVAPRIAALALRDHLWGRPRDGPVALEVASRIRDYAKRAVELSAVDDSPTRELLRVAEELVLNLQASNNSGDNDMRQLIAVLAGLTAPVFGQVESGPYPGAFGDVRRVDALSSDAQEWSPTLTADGQDAFFTSRKGSGDLDIWTARLGPDGTFGEPRRLDELNSDVDDANISVAGDGLTIVFDSVRPGGAGSWDLYLAVREDRRAPFEILRSAFGSINTPMADHAGHLSGDGLRLYFSRGQPNDLATAPDLFVAVRGEGEDWRDADVVPLDRLNTEYGEGYLSSSSNDEVVFFNDWFPGDPAWPPGSDIFVSWRQGPSPGDFGERALLPFPVNTAADDVTPWISPDWPAPGSQLWFVSNRGDGFDIYVATWFAVPDPVFFLRGDCNDDGEVDISDAVCILNWLFLGGGTPGCVAVTNTNGDTEADISDATYLLNHLFLGGPAPVPPFPRCGIGELPTDRATCETTPVNCQQ